MKAAAIKERPILMHARSIRGILEGRKTQSRRIVRHQPAVQNGKWYDEKADFWRNAEQYARDCCPYGKPRDRLWVRETWGGDDLCGYAYRADHPELPHFQGDGEQPDSAWKPSIHMPRKASRLTLEITNIRVERVQSISEEDAWAEGLFRIGEDLRTPAPVLVCDKPTPEAGMAYAEHASPYWTYAGNPIKAFETLWDDTNGKGAWERNDWCWVVEFKKL